MDRDRALFIASRAFSVIGIYLLTTAAIIFPMRLLGVSEYVCDKVFIRLLAQERFFFLGRSEGKRPCEVPKPLSPDVSRSKVVTLVERINSLSLLNQLEVCKV